MTLYTKEIKFPGEDWETETTKKIHKHDYERLGFYLLRLEDEMLRATWKSLYVYINGGREDLIETTRGDVGEAVGLAREKLFDIPGVKIEFRYDFYDVAVRVILQR